MNDNYATNRLVTKQYLQACERACGPLQGSGNAGGGTFPTLEDLDISKFNPVPVEDPYFIQNISRFTRYITRDNKY